MAPARCQKPITAGVSALFAVGEYAAPIVGRMSTNAFARVFGDPGTSVDLARRLAVAEGVAAEAQAQALSALAAAERARTRELNEIALREEAIEVARTARQDSDRLRLKRGEARHEVWSTLAELREVSARLAHYEPPPPPWMVPPSGQMSMTDTAGAFCEEGSVLVNFTNAKGTPRTTCLPLPVAEKLWEVRRARSETSPRERQGSCISATAAFKEAASAVGVSKNCTERLLVAMRVEAQAQARG